MLIIFMIRKNLKLILYQNQMNIQIPWRIQDHEQHPACARTRGEEEEGEIGCGTQDLKTSYTTEENYHMFNNVPLKKLISSI